MENSTERLALHFKYFAFIAAMTIILVATERWSGNREFTTYLSNAATMTSLLLGVVAIFYSFVSNAGMSRSLGGIGTVTNEVRSIRDEIQKFAVLTKEASDTASRNNDLAHLSSSKLSGSLTSLQDTLDVLATENQTLRQLLSNLPTKIDQLEAKVGDIVKLSGEKPQHAHQSSSPTYLPEKTIQEFLDRASLYNNLFFIAVAKAYEAKKPLVIEAFTKAVDWNYPSLCVGYLSCMHAIQLCTRKAIPGQTRHYRVTELHPTLLKTAREYYINYIESNFKEGDAERATWMEALTKVENLFSD